MEKTIPIIDMADFTSGDEARKKQFILELGQAYENVGFVAVVNHGIDQDLVDRFYKNVNTFFALPLDTKLQYEDKELAGQRGYTSFGREQAKGFDTPDLKEFWQFGQIVPEDSPRAHEYPKNPIVSELPEFNQVAIDLYKSFEKSGTTLLRAIALYLDLDENYFDHYVAQGNSILRAIHYPPITEEPKSAIRAEQHEDINLITLLVGASADGLEVYTKDNEWKAVTAGPGQIVVNVGDMLQRLCNNRLRSTTHRVVNPPRERWHTPRLSIPFFLHPISEMKLDCLPGCITTESPAAYPPITAGEYLDERLREIGLKK